MKFEEFKKDFIDEIRNDSQIEQDTPSNIFLSKMVQRLEEISVLFNTTIYPFLKPGQRGKIMRIDGYSFDDAEKSIILFINDYVDVFDASVLNQSQIIDYANKMSQFIYEVKEKTIFKYIDPSQIEFSNFLHTLSKRLRIDFVDEKDESIDKVKFVILTNKKLTNKKLKIGLPEFDLLKVDIDVWDIERIYDLIASGREREPLVIDFKEFEMSSGIPYIRADFQDNELYDAYLCIIPGKVLSDIYFEHGSRLLEGNVRTFLSVRGKINKNIRKTIKEEPKKFFAYNNGISCTAKQIEFTDDGRSIVKIHDLQIINGGQTTASLSSAVKKDKANLDLIYVPMKLTLIKDSENADAMQNRNAYEEMIQNIAKFANSQNKIKDSDFFSNHPFHRQMELLSKKISAAPKAGQFHSTYWFYERSRGAFEQEQFKLKNQTERDAFLRKYPKNQVIKKEELAKYMMAGKYLRPDIVSKGSEKNMIEFASEIDAVWTISNESINEHFFKEAVGFTILYRTLDRLVSSVADWYYVGGPKLNVIPYTIAKFFNSLPAGETLNLIKIWEKQGLSAALEEELLRIGHITLDFINESEGILVTEYAKKAETWEKFKNKKIAISNSIENDLINVNLIKDQEKSAKKEQKVLTTLEVEMKVMELAKSEEGNYWKRLLDEAKKRNLWTPKIQDIIMVVAELGNPFPKRLPSPSQIKFAWDFRQKLEDAGALV
jgi:hypothetical protein